jgi:hypothetical protein
VKKNESVLAREDWKRVLTSKEIDTAVVVAVSEGNNVRYEFVRATDVKSAGDGGKNPVIGLLTTPLTATFSTTPAGQYHEKNADGLKQGTPAPSKIFKNTYGVRSGPFVKYLQQRYEKHPATLKAMLDEQHVFFVLQLAYEYRMFRRMFESSSLLSTYERNQLLADALELVTAKTGGKYTATSPEVVDAAVFKYYCAREKGTVGFVTDPEKRKANEKFSAPLKATLSADARRAYETVSRLIAAETPFAEMHAALLAFTFSEIDKEGGGAYKMAMKGSRAAWSLYDLDQKAKVAEKPLPLSWTFKDPRTDSDYVYSEFVERGYKPYTIGVVKVNPDGSTGQLIPPASSHAKPFPDGSLVAASFSFSPYRVNEKYGIKVSIHGTVLIYAEAKFVEAELGSVDAQSASFVLKDDDDEAAEGGASTAASNGGEGFVRAEGADALLAAEAAAAAREAESAAASKRANEDADGAADGNNAKRTRV